MREMQDGRYSQYLCSSAYQMVHKNSALFSLPLLLPQTGSFHISKCQISLQRQPTSFAYQLSLRHRKGTYKLYGELGFQKER